MAEVKKKKKKSKKGLWFIVVVLLAAGLFVGWRILDAERETSRVLANIETEPYRRDDLSAFIFGTGSVQPAQTAVITWSASGTVADIHVSLGETVEKDTILMSLDPESLSMDIMQAEIDLINAQRSLDQLFENWQADLANTRLELLDAEDFLENRENRRWVMNYRRCTDGRIEELERELEFAQNLLDLFETSETRRLVRTAEANLNYCRADFSEREIAEAEYEIDLAQAQVNRLQNQVEKLTDGPDSDEVTILETRIAIAQSRLDSPMIKAPFAGVVTSLPAQPGDIVQVGAKAVQLDDLADLRLAVQISEIDIPEVMVGQPVELVFDAFFETIYTGEVKEISLVGTTVQGVVEYTVTVRMLDADERIRPGMTAAVTIVVDEKEDVFVVPNDAIVNLNGQEQVFVRRNGEFVSVPVILGSFSDFYSEVIEADIDEGELIVLNPPAEITGAMPFGGPPGGGGFGGPFGN